MSDNELCTRLAENVMGWTRTPYGEWNPGKGKRVVRGWYPDEDIEQAMMVAEKISDQEEWDMLCFRLVAKGQAQAKFVPYEVGVDSESKIVACGEWSNANAPALAIALAADAWLKRK